jgi:Tfp pilus assembly protein PilW
MRAPETDPGREAGTTIVELMITSALLILVILSVLGAFDQVSKSQAFQADRSAALGDMRNVINRMTRDLRQATAITDCGTNSSAVSYTTYVNGSPTDVAYSVSGATLTRQEGSGNPFPVLKSLASSEIFTCKSATDVTGVQWVDIDLQVTPKKLPTTTLELTSEVNLRNRTASLSGGGS